MLPSTTRRKKRTTLFKSDLGPFKNHLAEQIFVQKYQHEFCETWPKLAKTLVWEVCFDLLSHDEMETLCQYITEMKFVPGGRYLYYAGRPIKAYNNCYLLKVEDTRESWAELLHNAGSCLMSGGGIGVDYSAVRPSGLPLTRTGGISSGPISLMQMVNEVGRHVMQGGSRRSAMWAGLNWQHGDIEAFLGAKNWTKKIRRLKAEDFNFPAPLDMTNISINWDDDFLSMIKELPAFGEARIKQEGAITGIPDIWYDSVKRMCKTGEPGHAYNFGEQKNDTLRNA